MKTYDKIIIGAGLYGLYAALFCAKKGQKILVLEADDAPFRRATYINQARVHMGYHYPRSISTALKSRRYFDRFLDDFGFCVLTEFDQIYATGSRFSWTNAAQFRKFCRDADIRCDDLTVSNYFRDGMCDGAFLTTEYTYDALILKDHFVKELAPFPNVECRFGVAVAAITQVGGAYEITFDGERVAAPYVLNATYSGVNQIHRLAGFEPFKIKYELCEIILCSVSDNFKNIGFTVMDGPFFSIMPFGKSGLHSLTSVTFTPHVTSYDDVPTFRCQQASEGFCSSARLGNCSDCPAKPASAWPYMSNLARKYLKEDFAFSYHSSLFSMKPILKASEIDDSRPTVIKVFNESPLFVSVLSGKINTVYDLDEVLSI